MAGNPERLTCVSMIICDTVYRDERTKKSIIVGTFNRINATGLPFKYRREFTVLFSVTNAKGRYNLGLSIEHEASGVSLATLDGPAEFSDPLQITDINVEFHNVEFPEKGKYWVVLRSDDEIVSQRPFFVELLQGSPNDTGDAV